MRAIQPIEPAMTQDPASDDAELEWDAASAALTAVHPWVSPAELHGVLCGAVVAGEAPGDDRWLQLIWEHVGEDLAADADLEQLLGFLRQGLAGLERDNFDFRPLLPDDDAPLSERVQALAGYCGGFLSGFALSGGSTDALDEDGHEALKGMVAISGADADVSGSDDDESDFLELSEFVRMAVLMLREPAADDASSPDPTNTGPSGVRDA